MENLIMWYVEHRKNKSISEWWVHDYEGAAYLTNSDKEANALACFLNSVNLNGRSECFGTACENLLSLYRKQTTPIKPENTEEIERPITVRDFLNKLQELNPSLDDIILIHTYNGMRKIVQMQFYHVKENEYQSHFLKSIGIETYIISDDTLNQKAIVIE
jgi:hypothetical protein